MRNKEGIVLQNNYKCFGVPNKHSTLSVLEFKMVLGCGINKQFDCTIIINALGCRISNDVICYCTYEFKVSVMLDEQAMFICTRIITALGRPNKHDSLLRVQSIGHAR